MSHFPAFLLSVYFLGNLTWGAEGPVLAIARESGNVRISWPAAAAGLVLERATGAEGALAWGPVDRDVLSVADRFEVVAPITGGQQFFRLGPLMVLIPAGAFQMGNTFDDGTQFEGPLHDVFVSAFLMDKNLVTKEEWLRVRDWALGNGYAFDNGGSFKAANHPVHSINWYDAVKWCNARSEKEGLTPRYYTDASQMVVYKTGRPDLTNADVKWSANGYRLPTEAEWEKAARGGRVGNRFPWGDTISHSQANYFSASRFPYDVSPTRGFHPAYETGARPYTSPVGAFPANDYGLFDMAGNLFEWCWDRFDGLYYTLAEATLNDPHGRDSESSRVLRGGTWQEDFGPSARTSARTSEFPNHALYESGFRCVRGL